MRAERAEMLEKRRARSARYCVFDSVHGVARPAPKSSFSTISGVEQPPVSATAKSYSFCAWATTAAGSAGFVGVPTRLFMCRSK